MPKNLTGGKHCKKGKTRKQDSVLIEANEGEGQCYGLVTSKCGGQFINLKCSDEKDRKGYIRNALYRRERLNVGDIVLVSKREYATIGDKCDINFKYSKEQAQELKSKGLIKFDISENAEEYDPFHNDRDDEMMETAEEKEKRLRKQKNKTQEKVCATRECELSNTKEISSIPENQSISSEIHVENKETNSGDESEYETESDIEPIKNTIVTSIKEENMPTEKVNDVKKEYKIDIDDL